MPEDRMPRLSGGEQSWQSITTFAAQAAPERRQTAVEAAMRMWDSMHPGASADESLAAYVRIERLFGSGS